MKKGITVLAAALAAALACGCVPIQTEPAPVIEFEAQTWRLACPGESGSVEAQAAEYFAQRIAQSTNGAVTVEVMTGEDDGQAALGTDAELALCPSQSCAALDARLEVVSLPFLFSSEEEAAEALDGAGGDALAAVWAEHDARCIGIGEEGFRSLTNSRRAVSAPADLAGLRLRVGGSEMLRQAYDLWGAETISADWRMVFTALRTGTYDGQEETLRVADAAAVQTAQTDLTRWTAFYECLYFVMDQTCYDGLSPALQEIVDQCGRETAQEQRRLDREAETEILSRWKQITVTELTEEETAAFRQAAQPCYDRFAQQVSAELLAAFTDQDAAGGPA